MQKLDQLYVLVSSAHKTTHHDMIFTVLKNMSNTEINNTCALGGTECGIRNLPMLMLLDDKTGSCSSQADY